MMPSVSLHQLRLSSYQFERDAKTDRRQRNRRRGTRNATRSSGGVSSPASSPCKLQPAGRGHFSATTTTTSRLPGSKKAGKLLADPVGDGRRECAQQVEHLRTMCTPRWNRETSPSVCKVRRMGWSAGLVQKHHALFVQNRVLVSSLAPDGGGELCCRMRRRWGDLCLDNLHSPGSPR